MGKHLRFFWYNNIMIVRRTIPPIFVLVLGLTAAMGMELWRLAWVWIARRTNAYG